MKNLKYIKQFFLLLLSCCALKASEPISPTRQNWLNRKLLKLVSKNSVVSLRNIGVKAALNCGADPNSRDQFSLTCLHHAARYNNVHQIRQLVAARADIDVADKYGSKPLCYAIISGNDEAANDIINIVKNHYANNTTAYLERENGFNRTPLHLAVAFNRPVIVQRLLGLCVNPDGLNSVAENICYRTPLHCAAEISNFNLIELLLSYGANKDAVDPQQGTIFDILRKKDIPQSRACLEKLHKVIQYPAGGIPHADK